MVLARAVGASDAGGDAGGRRRCALKDLHRLQRVPWVLPSTSKVASSAS